jgi:hypothetical protein
MLICEDCGSRGWTPPCPCGGWRIDPAAIDNPEEHGLPTHEDDDFDEDGWAMDRLGRWYTRDDE